jgi:hypothetical protein
MLLSIIRAIAKQISHVSRTIFPSTSARSCRRRAIFPVLRTFRPRVQVRSCCTTQKCGLKVLVLPRNPPGARCIPPPRSWSASRLKKAALVNDRRCPRHCQKPDFPIGADGGIGDHTDTAGETESDARQQQMPDIRATIRAPRMQKDQHQAAHTISPSHNGRRASERSLCCHREFAVAYLLRNLAVRESVEWQWHKPCVSETSSSAPSHEAQLTPLACRRSCDRACGAS